MKKIVSLLLIGLIGLNICLSDTVYASEDDNYELGEFHQKDDAGYGDNKKLKRSDVHYGWELGHFSVSGYTRQSIGKDGNPLFLKNVGDEISIKFNLEQDISKLNGDKRLSINNDENGYDDYFGITKNNRTDFGKGTLLVKYTNYLNETEYVAPYTDYLKGVEKGASTKVYFFEEGDYEIALDYEIRKNNIDVWKIHTLPSYTHYQILAKFSVRNGNCMVYPHDISTKRELVNTSYTENGFYLDLAKSKYLNVDVKKLDYVESNNNLFEDTRFNKPASDGEEFIDEGIYIITVKNIYTEQETEKKIYVGTDPVLKAYVTTGKDIDYIEEMLAEGATIEDDGTITLKDNNVIDSTEETEVEDESDKSNNLITDNKQTQEDRTNSKEKILICCAIVTFFVVTIIVRKIRKRKDKK